MLKKCMLAVAQYGRPNSMPKKLKTPANAAVVATWLMAFNTKISASTFAKAEPDPRRDLEVLQQVMQSPGSLCRALPRMLLARSPITNTFYYNPTDTHCDRALKLVGELLLWLVVKFAFYQNFFSFTSGINSDAACIQASLQKQLAVYFVLGQVMQKTAQGIVKVAWMFRPKRKELKVLTPFFMMVYCVACWVCLLFVMNFVANSNLATSHTLFLSTSMGLILKYVARPSVIVIVRVLCLRCQGLKKLKKVVDDLKDDPSSPPVAGAALAAGPHQQQHADDNGLDIEEDRDTGGAGSSGLDHMPLPRCAPSEASSHVMAEEIGRSSREMASEVAEAADINLAADQEEEDTDDGFAQMDDHDCRAENERQISVLGPLPQFCSSFRSSVGLPERSLEDDDLEPPSPLGVRKKMKKPAAKDSDDDLEPPSPSGFRKKGKKLAQDDDLEPPSPSGFRKKMKTPDAKRAKDSERVPARKQPVQKSGREAKPDKECGPVRCMLA